LEGEIHRFLIMF